MHNYEIKVDKDQRELSIHGTVQFPMEINHDHLKRFSERYICCHWHEELEIPVVLSGSVRYQLKDKAYELCTGEGIIINSCIPHSAMSLGEEESVVLTTILHPSLLYGTPASSIYVNLLYPYMNTTSMSGILLTDKGTDVMKRIDTLYQNAYFGYELQIKSMLCELFFDILSPYKEMLSAYRPSNREALSRLELLLDVIHSSYAETLSLTELASTVSVSRESCCRFFKSMTGKTISQYLEDYRITQSILLLQDDKYSITQISYLVGFGNQGRFSTAFSKRMNCTPRQYRQRFHNKS